VVLIIVGIHAVKHALEASELLQEVIIEKEKRHPRIDELAHLARKAGVRVSFLARPALDRLATEAVHQGVVARLRAKAEPSFKEWLQALEMQQSSLVLVLDSVTDPHNLGACLRTAEAAGCAGVILPRDHSADLASPVVAKSASGAQIMLPTIHVPNLVRALEQMQKRGFFVYGLAGDASQSIYETDLTGKTAVVMGAEGRGLRRLVRESCDLLVHIPMLGKVESLNVSVATGVALFEVIRQGRG